jgi:hypothetical protein
MAKSSAPTPSIQGVIEGKCEAFMTHSVDYRRAADLAGFYFKTWATTTYGSLLAKNEIS